MQPRIAILVQRNYWTVSKSPGNAPAHRAVPDILAALRKAGAAPELVYQGTAPSARFHAIVLPGGGDVDPVFYGRTPGPGMQDSVLDTEFDRFQIEWAQAALEKGLPMLGICRGMQVINVAAGGTLIQHLDGHAPERVLQNPVLRAEPVHRIATLENTRTRNILGRRAHVNSIHHQAVEVLGSGLQATAWAEDGVVEALERASAPWQRAVQFHPEDMRDRAPFQRLFDSLVEDALTLSA